LAWGFVWNHFIYLIDNQVRSSKIVYLDLFGEGRLTENLEFMIPPLWMNMIFYLLII